MLEVSCDEDNIHSVRFANTIKYPNPEIPVITRTQNYQPLIKDCIKQLGEYFEGKRRTFYLPLKQEGSPFQQTVWTALLTIPFGKTMSYLELSKLIGNVKATRAVAASNGRNNISIIVPCHRVIGSNGDLTGYSGDLWRKKWLLQHEGKYANGIQTLF